MQTKDDEIIELYWKRDPKAIEETQTHYGGKSLADSHLAFWKTEKMHRNVSMILIFELGILYPRQDRSFSLRTLQRYAVFYVLMCWIIKMRKSEVLW